MPAKAQCPECKTISPISDAVVGKSLRCRKCRTKFVAVDLMALSTQLPEPPAGGAGFSAPSWPTQPPPFASPADTTRPASSSAFSATTVSPDVTGPLPGSSTLPLPATVTRRAFPTRQSGSVRILWHLVAALALLGPPAAAGVFAAYAWDNGQAPENPAPKTATVTYGGIEISSTGVKATLLEMFRDKELGSDCRVLGKASVKTKIGTPRPSGVFDPDEVRKTVSAVSGFHHQFLATHKVPADRVYVVVGSGVFNKMKSITDLDQTAIQDLVKRNESYLSDAIGQNIGGAKVEFIDADKEVKLLIRGLLPPKRSQDGLLVDVGTNGTRGGYRVGGDVGRDSYATFEFSRAGLSPYETLVLKKAGGPNEFPRFAAALAWSELREPIQLEVDKTPSFRTRKKVYLNGGVVWVLTTLLHPADRGTYPELSVDDFDEFLKVLLRDPSAFPSVTLPPDLDPAVRATVQAEIRKMKDIWDNPRRLIAGAEILKALSAEFGFKDKKLSFIREGEIGWLLGFIKERYEASN